MSVFILKIHDMNKLGYKVGTSLVYEMILPSELWLGVLCGKQLKYYTF